MSDLHGPLPTLPTLTPEPAAPAGVSPDTTATWPATPGAVGPVAPAGGRNRGRGRTLLAGVALGALVGGLAGGGVVALTTDPGTPAPGSIAAAAISTVPVEGLDVGAVLARVEPAVVAIATTAATGSGAGSGFIVTADGTVVTNAHVVEGAQRIQVRLADGRTLDAELLGSDPSRDLAVLAVDATGLPVVELATDPVGVGQPVVAIGNALGLGDTPTVTTGIVSAVDRSIQTPGARLRNLLQTDAAINPGNSGGPLVDARGRVVGINTAIAGGANNIGFAIAVSEVGDVIDGLATGEVPARAFLGVGLEDAVDGGARITQVTPGSAADRAGLEAGDVIVAIAGAPIADADDVIDAVDDRAPGDPAELEVRRAGATVSVSVTLGSRPTS